MSNTRKADIAGLVAMLFLAGPIVGVATFVAGVLLGGVSLESNAPRSPAQYLSYLIVGLWGVLSYFAARYAGLRGISATIAAVLAGIWSIGSLLLVIVIA